MLLFSPPVLGIEHSRRAFHPSCVLQTVPSSLSPPTPSPLYPPYPSLALQGDFFKECLNFLHRKGLSPSFPQDSSSKNLSCLPSPETKAKDRKSDRQGEMRYQVTGVSLLPWDSSTPAVSSSTASATSNMIPPTANTRTLGTPENSMVPRDPHRKACGFCLLAPGMSGTLLPFRAVIQAQGLCCCQ